MANQLSKREKAILLKKTLLGAIEKFNLSPKLRDVKITLAPKKTFGQFIFIGENKIYWVNRPKNPDEELEKKSFDSVDDLLFDICYSDILCTIVFFPKRKGISLLSFARPRNPFEAVNFLKRDISLYLKKQKINQNLNLKQPKINHINRGRKWGNIMACGLGILTVLPYVWEEKYSVLTQFEKVAAHLTVAILLWLLVFLKIGEMYDKFNRGLPISLTKEQKISFIIPIIFISFSLYKLCL